MCRIEPEEIVIDDDFASDAIVRVVEPEEFGLAIQDCRPDAIREAWSDPVLQAGHG